MKEACLLDTRIGQYGNNKKIKSKKGISGSVIGIILLVISLAILVGLVIYFGTQGKEGVSGFLEQIFFIKRGA